MDTFRVYVNRKITAKGGGEHLRFEDVQAKDRDAAGGKVKLKKTEALGDIVQLATEVMTP